METVKNYIGGNPVAAEVDEELDVPDPATEELLGRVPLSGKEDVDRVVQAAAEGIYGKAELRRSCDNGIL